MILFFRQNSKNLTISALVSAYLATCFFSLWFHQHPDHDHAEMKGSAYHSHVSALASHVQKFEQDHHDSRGSLHLLGDAPLFEKMQAAIPAHFGQVFTPGKFVQQIDSFVAPVVENSAQNSVVKTVLKLPPIQTARDYFALTATGLSPPLA